MALSPLAYWPCNETYYTNIHDETGNNRFGTALNVTNNVSGKYGAALQFGGSSTSKIISSPALTAVLDPNEYSISAWAKVTVNASLQVRIFNLWNSGISEYSAVEIRNGDRYNLFFREGGSDQNITGGLPTATDGVWEHVVIFNSVSQGIMGMYFNGTKYQYSRTLAGMTGPILTGFPEIGMQLSGCMQHIAFFNHALTQAEVNTICT